MITIWIAYIVGALMCLWWKWRGYRVKHPGLLRPTLRKWLFAHSAESRMSWFTTICIVWIIGSVYIEKIGLYQAGIQGLIALPVTHSIAGLLGWMAELLAPNILRALIGRLNGDWRECD